MPEPLDYLVFDLSDDTDGVTCFDAMAAIRPEHRAPVLQEVDRVLDWARRQFPNGPGPVQDGFDWDFDLQHEATGQGDEAWHETRLSITASPAFASAFSQCFAPEVDAG